MVIHSSFILSSYFGCSLFQRSKSGKSQDKEKPVVAFLQPFCGFQNILEGPDVNCGDLECDPECDLEHALVGENKEAARDGNRVGEDKEG